MFSPLQDALRVSKLLQDHSAEIASVHVTLDSHQRMHIAHGLFWQDAAGNPPALFTIISREDVVAGKWRSVKEAHRERSLHYVEELERNGKFSLCIWPEHCIIGSEGHNVTAPINEGLTAWSETTREEVDWLLKGQNIFTEMYSALKAEVVDESDGRTTLNQEMIDRLSTKERVLVCGQAMSHCVNFTVRDLVEHWPQGERHRIWLLEDAMSSVPGFEAAGEEFLTDMRALGLTIVTTDMALEARTPQALKEVPLPQGQLQAGPEEEEVLA